MPMKKSEEVRRLERGIEDHSRRACQATHAGQKDRARFHQRQVKIWRKWLDRRQTPDSGVLNASM